MFASKRFINVISAISIGSLVILLLTLAAVARWRGQAAAAAFDAAASAPAEQRQAEMKEAYRRLPMNFEVNRGQADRAVKFIARGRGYQVFLTRDEAVLVLQHTADAVRHDEASAPRLPSAVRSSALRLKLHDAQTATQIAGVNLLPGKSNYLIGADPAAWQRDIPNYARVEYAEVYPGIAVAYYGTQSALEYDFVVAPGADPRRITMTLEGADKIELADNGDLILQVDGQKLYHRAPVSFQTINGKQRPVTSRYVLKGGNQIGFAVAGYDATKPLTIDPIIDFSTFFGGIGSDEGFAIAVDLAGNAYVTGTTYSNNFNTFAPLQTINRGGKYDAFVTKINAAGTTILYSTYLGGTGEDSGHGIAVDANGNAYVAGITNSPDFNTRNALQPNHSFVDDAFVTKLNASGTELIFSTYLGGSSSDQAFAIAVDGNGDAYVAGSTVSTNFPTRNPLQAANRGGTDVFVAKIRGDGAELRYSTYLGGSDFDEAYGIALDPFGNAYIAGATASNNFNILNALQENNRGGGSDGFVAKLTANGTALAFSTYLGGSGVDVAYGIAVDVNTNPYVTGHTFSTDFNVLNALQPENAGGADAFLSRINATGGAFVYSTYLGGSNGDFGRGVAVDANANAYLAGRTISTDFPTRNPLQPTNRGEFDAFVAKFNLTGSQLVYSTYLGGASDDLGFGIAVDTAGNAYVTGDTRSTDFNTRNPLQAANRGGLDVFVSKLNTNGSQLVYSTYLGGSGEDLGLSIALDTAGNVYITGYTSSNDFSTITPIQATSRGGLEVFVTKIFADASNIIYNTYFGGNGSDVGNGIAVDGSGSAYVVGSTTSTNLTTRNPIQPTNRGGLDAFVAKFNPTGSNLVYSTYLGGTFSDLGRSIAVDFAGNAFVVGTTFSEDFPTQSAFQPTNRGLGDAFVARLNSAGSQLVYSSYLGGAGSDEAAGVAADNAGSAYVVGSTTSGDFNTRNPLQPNNQGQTDIFISKVNLDGSGLVYSTYLGGQRADVGYGVAVDMMGNVYVTGSTTSTNFPVQQPLQASYGGGDFDAFAAAINTTGTALIYSTYLGGSLGDVANAIAVDPFGNAYIVGVTASTNFPAHNPIQAENRGGNEAFITKLGPGGTGLVYSTYLGGSGDDRASGIAVDAEGTAYVTGATASANFNIQFPLLAYGGGTDVFVAKILSEPSVALSPQTLELQASASGTMTVTISAAQSQPITITLTSSNAGVASVPPNVTIQPGAVSADFTVTGAAPGSATITAALPQAQGGATATATVNVVTSNRFLRAASVSGAGGGQITVPIELVAQGNETRLAFSISVNPQLLLNPQFTLGSDAAAAGATLNTNNSQAGQGRYGITINLPAGQTFAAGTRQVLVLTAVIITGSGAGSTPVNFGDQPTVRRVTDPNGQTLNTNYTNGTITIATGYEGDVAPRPNGSNGTVTIADWVQTGRFAAGFDTVAAGSEFQRADTAPRSSLGNGALTISDWVQTGRYSAGLDPVVPAGGPTAPAGLRSDEGGTINYEVGFGFPSFIPLPSSLQQGRVLRVITTGAQRGQQVVVPIELDAQGDENAFGFSLNYDPAQLTFVSAALGADMTNGMLNVNNTQAAQGRLGFALALPTGSAIAAGNNRRVVNLTFAIPANGTANTNPLTFSDQPVVREIVNANADTLTVTYVPGAVSIAQPLANVSAASFLGAELASAQIVAAFGTNLATTTQLATTVPLPTNLGGTTVRVRDSAGTTRDAPLFFVAPTQVNYQVPPGTVTGAATVTITSSNGSLSVGMVNITSVAPGIFTADASGRGLAAAVALRIKADGTQTSEPIGQFDVAQGRFVPIPIDLGPEGEQVFLIIFGTGLRGRSSLANVNVKIGGADAEVQFLGQQGGFVGLDQGNIRIPRSLIGRGEVDVVTVVDGKMANTVRVSIK